MPTYLYFCPRHLEFEVIHSIKEKLDDCPKCIEDGIDYPYKLRRLISSGTSFILNGSGWASSGYS